MTTTPLYKINDARRMAATMTTIQSERGEHIGVSRATINRMSRITASALAAYASRPKHYRTAVLTSASNRAIRFHIGTEV